MIKNKMIVIAMAGVLAMCIGLTACGSGNGGGNASGSAATSAAGTSAAASAAVDTSAPVSNEILYWEGAFEDGTSVTYMDNAIEGYTIMAIVKGDLSDAAVWAGFSTVDENGLVTVTDSETKNTVSFTVVDVTPSSCKIDIVGYGQVDLQPVTEADVQAFADELAAAASEGEKLLKELANL